KVEAEGLIAPGAVSTGNIGLVGTAGAADMETMILSDYQGTQSLYGPYGAYNGGAGTGNLTRAAEILYRNGAGVVYSRSLAAGADEAAFEAAFVELLKDDVNILVAPELPTQTALDVLKPIVENEVAHGRDLIAVVGSDATTPANIKSQVEASD